MRYLGIPFATEDCRQHTRTLSDLTGADRTLHQRSYIRHSSRYDLTNNIRVSQFVEFHCVYIKCHYYKNVEYLLIRRFTAMYTKSQEGSAVITSDL